MKCTNKRQKISFILVIILLLTSLTGCGGPKYSFAYDSEYDVSSFQIIQKENKAVTETFARNLCIAPVGVTAESGLDMSSVTSAVLFDLSQNDVIFSQNAHEQLNPASLTKVMTAIVALKYGSMNQVLTATSVIKMEDPDATRIKKMKEGDTMTLSQALHILLVYSANDVANMVAEGVAGSVDAFVELMNQEAQALGATNTRFANPHGLTQEGHYTTAYDLYLIFNEAIKYDIFREIITMPSYSTVYYDKNGKEKELEVKTTNRYFRGDYESPSSVTILGGKTGTTEAAGNCLILLSKDANNDLYISVILCASERDILYHKMTELLNEIGK